MYLFKDKCEVLCAKCKKIKSAKCKAQCDPGLLDVLFLGDVLADAHHADDRTRRPTPRRRVQQQLNTPAILRMDGELKILAVMARERPLEHLLPNSRRALGVST